ncbi:MAG TPA: hypothetical protein VI197_07670 [Polyangiaceae bacterium]
MSQPALSRLMCGMLVLLAAALGGGASCNSPSFEIPAEGGGGSGGGITRDELCENDERDGGETDVDCGGVCEPCENGRDCAVDDDCVSDACIDEMCQLKTCNDGAQSPGETGMDCGGPDCQKCLPGNGCMGDDDCTSGICTDNVCVEPSCGDTKRNGEETDVDCGGDECEGCATDQACERDSDCVSGECRDETCAVACATGSGDCDGDNVCETNTTLDVEHCGACDTVCELPNATPQCVGGECEILECEPPYEDCDLDPTNGCEVDLEADPDHCGGCFNACVELNGAATCAEAVCGIDCDTGFDDCDERPENGCEKDLTRDVANCGACGEACEAETEEETVYCDANGCGATICESGLGDCDGDGVCETELSDSETDCGACGNLCVAANGTASCEAGECVVEDCNEGYSDCNSEYSDGCEAELAVDALNCGECETTCGADCNAETGSCNVDEGTAWCSEGECKVKTCATDHRDCNGDVEDGCEVDYTSDSGNCGGCASAGGRDCSAQFAHADAHCEAGECVFDACQDDWRDCEGGVADGCESNVTSDVQDCGACDKVCGTTNASATACTAGACDPECTGSWDTCGGSENGCTTNLANDEANCGGCGSSFACASTGTSSNNCVDSSCDPKCSSGRGDCDTSRYNGCETNTNTSTSNCGGCDDACSSANGGTASCSSGQCAVTCGSSFKSCNNENSARDGCETDVRSSTSNCGGCNAACSGANGGTASCSDGQCAVSCGSNFKNCNNENTARDGCETDVRNDPDNCGACNTNCVFCDGTTCLQHLDVTVVKTSGEQETSTSTGCGSTQLTMTHTLTSGSDLEHDYRLLVLGLGFQANTNNATPCEVSYGAQTFTRVTDLAATDGTVGYIYIMKEDKLRAASNDSLVVRINEHNSYGIIAAQLLELTGVDQVNPINGAHQTTNTSFSLNPSSGSGLTVGDPGSLVYTHIARRSAEPTASFRTFYQSIRDARVAAGHFFADDDDAASTISWGGGGFSHKLSAISVQRAVNVCQTGC